MSEFRVQPRRPPILGWEILTALRESDVHRQHVDHWSAPGYANR